MSEEISEPKSTSEEANGSKAEYSLIPPAGGEPGQGKVVFVGAGPGAPDLITVRGARVIAQADIIIWASSLVSPEIVAGHKPDALLVDSATESLEDITPLYERVRDEGLLIARVHTGDPAIYGATAEQREVLRDLGVAYESIPGVSAFSAAAARSDVEITLPEVSQSLILTRLEGGRTPMPPRESVREFATHGTTMALYLSAARSHTLQEELLAGGYAPDTPVIIGHQVTWPDEIMVRCTLDQLAATMKEHKFWKHTVILVGPALAETKMVKRSHLYHPGFRHEYRDADPAAAKELAERGAQA
ncbi:precorrin-4 C(11)-methyltransferase [Propionimicrobium sp. PCR01-08-3]|uniref:precorrin-4 C(11)-methyltransferase n=1 Tax=Propionimicrobium sp. PCR01-08-3 TaxID=3052086 RepID=UPI00255CE4C2|nr:precorrin-4 C(11)-methyltransferase [Propionimicrobium sp. PCR01-08-3]WIY82196.1 precorrin-4 C(11)-methyltransferase [Propionimicrobium sp. PCR01-08-3]